jgi:hypothetical protein
MHSSLASLARPLMSSVEVFVISVPSYIVFTKTWIVLSASLSTCGSTG